MLEGRAQGRRDTNRESCIGDYLVKKKTKIALLRILMAVALAPIAYVIGAVVVRSFFSISDDNPILTVTATLGGVSIWWLFLSRLKQNIDRDSDNPYGEALAHTTEQSGRLVVALFMLFTLGTLVQQSIGTKSYWWVVALVVVFLLSKPTRHFRAWLSSFKVLGNKLLLLDTKDKGLPAAENSDNRRHIHWQERCSAEANARVVVCDRAGRRGWAYRFALQAIVMLPLRPFGVVPRPLPLLLRLEVPTRRLQGGLSRHLLPRSSLPTQ